MAAGAWHAKTVQLCNSAALVPWSRYSAIYLVRSVGLSPTQAGLIKSLSMAAKAAAQPLWGRLADRTGRPDRVLLVGLLAGVGLLMLTRLVCELPAQAFWQIAAVRMLRSSVTATNGVLNALTVQLVRGTGEGYGPQRLWGSLGWGLFSGLTGVAIDWLGIESIFTLTYWLSLLYGLVLLSPRIGAAMAATPPQPMKSARGTADESGDGARSVPPPVMALLVVSFLHGLVLVVPDQMLYLQIELEYGLSSSANGMASAVSVLSGFPLLAYSDRLLARFGHARLIFGSQLVLMLRLWLHASINGPQASGWPVWALQLLHGPCWAPAQAASVELIELLAPVGSRSYLQSLYVLFQATLAGAMGNYMWAALFEASGKQGYEMHCVAAVLLAGNLILSYCLFSRLGWTTKGAALPL